MISSPTCTIGGDGGWSFTQPVCELEFEKSSISPGCASRELLAEKAV
jgi:hypothetical protein